MTVSSSATRVSYAGNGSTETFSTGFKFLANGDLVVIIQDTNGDDDVQVLNTDYTVDGAGEDTGGSITFTTAPGASDTVVIYLDPELEQTTDFTEGDSFPVENVETALDRGVMISKRLKDRLDRAPTLIEGDTDGEGRFDARENRIVDLGDPEDDQDAATKAWTQGQITSAVLGDYGGSISPFMTTLLDDANANTALTTLLFTTLTKSLRLQTTGEDYLNTIGIDASVAQALLAGNLAAVLSALGFSTFIQTLIDDTTAATARTTLGAPAIPKTIGGLEISQAADADNDITFAAGVASNQAGTGYLTLTSPMTKRLDVSQWTSGTGNGGLATGATHDSGVAAASTWYHCFIVDKADGTVDCGFDNNVAASNLLTDTGGSNYHMVGSILTDGSKAITDFTQVGNIFKWTTPPLDISASTFGATTRVNFALSVPLGIRSIAKIRAFFIRNGVGAPTYAVLGDHDETDAPASDTASPLSTYNNVISGATWDNQTTQLHIQTNTSKQIYGRSQSASTKVSIVTVSYEHPRGRW